MLSQHVLSGMVCALWILFTLKAQVVTSLHCELPIVAIQSENNLPTQVSTK